MALYLYALVDGLKRAPRVRGVAAGPLRLLRAGGFTLLVGEAPANLDAGDLSALRRHDRVVRAAHARARAALPLRFGTSADSPREAASLIRAQAKALRAALKTVQDREQLTLRLLGPAPLGVSEAPAAPRTSGAAYLAARAKAEATRRSVPELDGLRAALGGLIRVERAERASGPGPVRATVFHLVDRGAGRAYLRRVKSAPTLPGEWRLFVSGPGPAWAFGPEALR